MSLSSDLLQVLTLRCERASELSSQEMDGPLSTLERLALCGHLLLCVSCRRFRGQTQLIRAAVRRRQRSLDDEQGGIGDGSLSAEARRRIACALRQALPDAGDPMP